MTSALIPGADPWSHIADDRPDGSARGALVLHGFTGNPGSMRGVATALGDNGFHVEMPLLPGHGTVVDDMLPTRWADWSGEAEAAYQRLRARASDIVVVGLSMGGALTLRVGADHPEIAGLVCINPVAQPQPAEVVEMLDGLIAGGTPVLPGVGSDIADPESKESAYEGTPVEALRSLLVDGIGPLSTEYAQMRIPLLLMNSPQDHVVDPGQAEFLAGLYGGPLERITLEHSYHVATQDYDKDLIEKATVEFAGRVTSR
jgi:carboxylesterase